ncbi:MAG: tyrosine--tRNA ligase [Candidatus Portnoybacteria bacterium CG06_land_8_20_14_3_00_39_12]|uniref:Tyrosine--tRNA ligase n=1 Tax=Candidatus Portnoybacteria bacterium CG06_land_8_20_14_3_00_39_12 TaxID=1974809 RepID=A0A2M7AY66_9BACT|nr:MAG: tyrosine--tRNA ligase [Candidatus Portnoybacteria bacterium CG06_land_8_20_14_3_00_39_12]
MNALDILKERGFVQQCSNENGLRALFSRAKVVYYAGFDPTADSLHVGHLIPIMAMANLQRAGHTPIIIIGGGTALIGDPSGKTEMRRIITREEIARNIAKLLPQFKRYLEIGNGKGTLFDNADWLAGLNYIEFLRDIGRHFKVNEMIRNEGYRLRLERKEGLSFIEFNYQLLQAYDFLVLFERHGCILQVGGDDQWGNILAGINLVRQVKREVVYALTFPLITTASGQKMGKTETGAIWLDATRTSPYNFYQYWINVDDRDVIRFLKMFTFLSMEKINELAKLQGADIRKVKEILAYETTKLAHGEEEAKKARKTAGAAFAKTEEDSSGLPTTVVSETRIAEGIPVVDLFFEAGLAPSKGTARRLIEQGGAYVNDQKITATDAVIKRDVFRNNACIIRHGKKQQHRIVIGD